MKNRTVTSSDIKTLSNTRIDIVEFGTGADSDTYDIHISRSNVFSKFLRNGNSHHKFVFVVIPTIKGAFDYRKSQLVPQKLELPIEKTMSKEATEKNSDKLKQTGLLKEEIRLIIKERVFSVIYRTKFFKNLPEVVKFALNNYFCCDLVRESLIFTNPDFFTNKSFENFDFEGEALLSLNDDRDVLMEDKEDVTVSDLDSSRLTVLSEPRQESNRLSGSLPPMLIHKSNLLSFDDRKVSDEFLERINELDTEEKRYSINDIFDLPDEIIYMYHLSLHKKYEKIIVLYKRIMETEKKKENSDLNKAFIRFVDKVKVDFPSVWLECEFSNISKEMIIRKPKTRSSELYLFERLHFYNQSFNYFQKAIGVTLYMNGLSYDDMKITKSSGVTICGKSASDIVANLNIINKGKYFKLLKNYKKVLVIHIIDNFKETVKTAYSKMNFNQESDKLAFPFIPSLDNFDATRDFNSGENGIDSKIDDGIGEKIYKYYTCKETELLFSELSKMNYTTKELENEASQYYSQVGSIFLDLERKDSSKTIEVMDMINKILIKKYCSSDENYKIDDLFCFDFGLTKQTALYQDGVKYLLELSADDMKEKFNLDRTSEFENFLRQVLKIIPVIDVLHCCGTSYDAIVKHPFFENYFLDLHKFLTGEDNYPTVEKKLVYFRELVGTFCFGVSRAMNDINEEEIPDDDYFTIFFDIANFTAPFFYYLPFLWVYRSKNLDEIFQLLAMLFYGLKKLGRTNYETHTVFMFHILTSLENCNKRMCDAFVEGFKYFHESKIELGHNDINNMKKKNITSSLEHTNKIINCLSEYQQLQKFKKSFFSIEKRKAYSWWTSNIKEKNIEYAKKSFLDLYRNEKLKREGWIEIGFASHVVQKDLEKYKTDRFRLRIPSERIQSRRRNSVVIDNKYRGYSIFMLEEQINSFLDRSINIQNLIDGFYGRNTKSNNELNERRNEIICHIEKTWNGVKNQFPEVRLRINEFIENGIVNPLFYGKKPSRKGTIQLNDIEKHVLLYLCSPLDDFSFIPKSVYQEISSCFEKATGILKSSESILQFKSKNRTTVFDMNVINFLRERFGEIFILIESFTADLRESKLNILIQEHKKKIRENNLSRIKKRGEYEFMKPDFNEYFSEYVPKVERNEAKEITKSNKRNFESIDYMDVSEKTPGIIKKRRYTGNQAIYQKYCCIKDCTRTITLQYTTSSLRMKFETKENLIKMGFNKICFSCYSKDRRNHHQFKNNILNVQKQNYIKTVEY